MEIGQPDPGVGQPVQIGGLDLAAEGADVGEPEVVRHDYQEVRPCHGEASCQVSRPDGNVPATADSIPPESSLGCAT